jgi:hypothetical protein
VTPKIYAYCYGIEGWTDVIGAAIAEDGAGLAVHLSSNEEWSRHDMQSPAKAEHYAAYYPNGYELVWLGYRPDFATHPEFAAALRLNQARP